MEELEAAPEAPPRPIPARRGPRLRPALVVLGIAALVLLVFGAWSAVTGGGPGPSPAAGVAVPAGHTPVRGTPLLAQPAAKALAPIRQPGTPPANIVDSLALPVGATAVSHTRSAGITLFDARERFTVQGTQEAVIAFYRAELATTEWTITHVGPARGHAHATEVLGQKAGSDGWYWEVGVVVSPTTFGTGSGASGTTPFELRLFEVNDAS